MRLRCRLGIHRCAVRRYTQCECCGQRFLWDADHGKFNLKRHPEFNLTPPDTGKRTSYGPGC